MSAPEPTSDLKGHILVVDDRLASLNATTGILEQLGYECSGFTSGEETLAFLDGVQEVPSACILDQELQATDGSSQNELTGMQTLVELRKKCPAMRVIVFTAYEHRGREAINHGASFYLHKPATSFHLATLVDALVEMRQLEDSMAMTIDDRDRLQGYIDAIGVEMMVIDANYTVLMVNETKKRALGLPDDVVGSKCYEVACDRERPCSDCPLVYRPSQDQFVPRERVARGTTQLVYAGPIYDHRGRIEKIVEIAIDISRRKLAIQLLEQLQHASMGSIDALAERVVESLEGMGYDRARLYLMDGDSPVGWAASGMQPGFDIRTVRLTWDDPIAISVFDKGKPILLEGEEFRAKDRYSMGLDKVGVTSQIEVPLISAGEMVGLISIDNKLTGNRLTGQDLDILTFLGAAIADAIRNAKAIEEIHRQIRRLPRLRGIDGELSILNNIKDVFRTIVMVLEQTLQADSAILLVRDGVRGLFSAEAVQGNVPDGSLGPHPGNIGIVGWCLRTQEVRVVNDLYNDEGFQEYLRKTDDPKQWKEYFETRSAILAVPVCRGAESIGALLVCFAEARDVSEQDKTFLKDVADRAAIALAKLEESRWIEAAEIEMAKLSDLGLMASGVAHGVRNPLAIVLSAVELAETETLPSFAREKLAEARTELVKAHENVNRLLRWTRPEGNEPKSVHLSSLIEELREVVAQKLDDNQIDFKLDVSPASPRAFVPPDRIKMAILDLLSNAVAAMPNGGVLETRISNIPEGDAVRLEISDTGHGIPEEKQRELFERTPTQPRPAGGMGLGLYLANKVITAAGGSIRCESKVGEGTTFVVELPSEREEPDEQA